MSDLDLEALEAACAGFHGRFFWQEGHTVDHGIGTVHDSYEVDDALVYIAEDDDCDTLTRDDVFVISDSVEQHVAEPLATILNAAPALIAMARRCAALEAALGEACDEWARNAEHGDEFAAIRKARSLLLTKGEGDGR